MADGHGTAPASASASEVVVANDQKHATSEPAPSEDEHGAHAPSPSTPHSSAWDAIAKEANQTNEIDEVTEAAVQNLRLQLSVSKHHREALQVTHDELERLKVLVEQNTQADKARHANTTSTLDRLQGDAQQATNQILQAQFTLAEQSKRFDALHEAIHDESKQRAELADALAETSKQQVSANEALKENVTKALDVERERISEAASRLDGVAKWLHDAMEEHASMADQQRERKAEFEAKLELAVNDVVRRVERTDAVASEQAKMLAASEKRIETLEQKVENLLARFGEQAVVIAEMKKTTEDEAQVAKDARSLHASRLDAIEERKLPDAEHAIAGLRREVNDVVDRVLAATREARTKADQQDVNELSERVNAMNDGLIGVKKLSVTCEVASKDALEKANLLKQQVDKLEDLFSLTADKVNRALNEGLPADVRENLEKMQEDLRLRMAEIEKNSSDLRSLLQGEIDKILVGRRDEASRLLASVEDKLMRYTLREDFEEQRSRIDRLSKRPVAESQPVAPTSTHETVHETVYETVYETVHETDNRGNIVERQVKRAVPAASPESMKEWAAAQLEEMAENHASMIKKINLRLRMHEDQLMLRAHAEEVDASVLDVRGRIEQVLDRLEDVRSKTETANSKADATNRAIGAIKMDLEQSRFATEQAVDMVRNLRIPNVDGLCTTDEVHKLHDELSTRVSSLDDIMTPTMVVQEHMARHLAYSGVDDESGKSEASLLRIDRIEELMSEVARGAASAPALRALQRDVANLHMMLRQSGAGGGDNASLATMHVRGPRNDEVWTCLSCEKGPIGMTHRAPKDTLPDMPSFVADDGTNRSPRTVVSRASTSSGTMQLNLSAQRSQAEMREELLAYRARSASPGNPWNEKSARVPGNFYHASRALEHETTALAGTVRRPTSSRSISKAYMSVGIASPNSTSPVATKVKPRIRSARASPTSPAMGPSTPEPMRTSRRA
ncbi:hypothetical protein RI054_10g51540 [Pseudoscourfieldia marina]